VTDERDPSFSGTHEWGPPAHDMPAWEPGQLVSRRYLLERQLGGGSTGEVWLAEDRLLRKSVALKALQRELAQSRETVHRFLREVALAHSVTHRHVVRIYDTGEADGLPFFTMEYLQGKTLDELLEQSEDQPTERLSFAEIRQIAFDVLDGMEAAHRVGVVHRDLKPGNVMLTHRGAIVMDFGVAGIEEVSEAPNAASARSLVRTEAGTIFGSPAYMAPELWDGSPATVQSDLYAFGVLMYQMLTGRLPYEASSASSYLQKLNEGPPPPVRTLRRDTPWSVDRLVRRCMAHDPADRPQSAAAAANLIAPLRDKARRRALLVLALAATAATSAFIARPKPTYRALGLPDAIAEVDLAAAVRTFDVGEAPAALRSLERLAQRVPASAAVRFWEATVLEDLGLHVERRRRCASAPAHVGAAPWLALAEAACGRRYGLPEDAVERLPGLLPLFARHEVLPRLEATTRGTPEAEASERRRARRTLDRLERTTSADAWAMPTRAAIARIELELALGRPGEAEHNLSALLEHGANLPLVQTRAAWLALHRGELDRAEALADDLAEFDPSARLLVQLYTGRLQEAWSTIEARPEAMLRAAWIEAWCGFAWRLEADPPPPQCVEQRQGLAATLWTREDATSTVLEEVLAAEERLDPCARDLDPTPRISHAHAPFELRLGELAVEGALCRGTARDLEQAQSLASRLYALAPSHPFVALLYADVQERRDREAAARSLRLAVAELWRRADPLPRVVRLRSQLATTSEPAPP